MSCEESINNFFLFQSLFDAILVTEKEKKYDVNCFLSDRDLKLISPDLDQARNFGFDRILIHNTDFYRWTEKLAAAENPSDIVQEPMTDFFVKEEEMNSNEDESKEFESRWEMFLCITKIIFLFYISSKLACYQSCH